MLVKMIREMDIFEGLVEFTIKISVLYYWTNENDYYYAPVNSRFRLAEECIRLELPM